MALRTRAVLRHSPLGYHPGDVRQWISELEARLELAADENWDLRERLTTSEAAVQAVEMQLAEARAEAESRAMELEARTAELALQAARLNRRAAKLDEYEQLLAAEAQLFRVPSTARHA